MIKKTIIKIYSLINNFLYYLWFKLEYIWPHRYLRVKNLWIKTILDVWASRWQSVQRRRSLLGKNIYFHCFEPLQHSFWILKEKYGEEKYIHLHHYALGNENTTQSMHVSNIDDSSSLLPPTSIMNDTYKQIHFERQESITIKRLDDTRSSLQVTWPILMKVDTQWFEEKVFDGAKETLQKHVKLIVVELSFQEFYEWQPLFNDICNQLEWYGFRYYGSFEQSADPKDGNPLQQDAIFINNTLS